MNKHIDITKSLFYVKLPAMLEEPGDKPIILKSMLMSYCMVQKLSDFYKSYTYESETGRPYYKVLQEYNMRNSDFERDTYAYMYYKEIGNEEIVKTFEKSNIFERKNE